MPHHNCFKRYLILRRARWKGAERINYLYYTLYSVYSVVRMDDATTINVLLFSHLKDVYRRVFVIRSDPRLDDDPLVELSFQSAQQDLDAVVGRPPILIDHRPTAHGLQEFANRHVSDASDLS